MARCIIIGSEAHAAETARLLTTSDVPSKAIVWNPDHAKVIADCKREKGLEVVGVFCTDFPNDSIDFLRALREALDPSIHIHALKDGTGRTEPATHVLAGLNIDEVFSFNSLRSVHAATSIKTRWFPRAERQLESSARSMSTTHTGATVVRTSVETPSRLLPLRTTKPPQQARPSGTIVRSTDAAKGSGETVLPSALKPPAFVRLLSVVERNSVLPPQPKIVNIVGKHGTIVELDPRRIKPMPDNPRWATNPGFSPESLRELGEGLKLVGQAEPGEVCPIVEDPGFDAQLIDGERRMRGCMIVGVMFRASVREDVTADMLPALWALSVVRNNSKEPPTVRELVHIVSRLRSEEFGFTLEEVSAAIGKGVGTVQRLSILGRLHPQVQSMLDDAPEEGVGDTDAGGKPKKRRTRKLTSQLALLLADFQLEEQLTKAETIVAKAMNYKQARRYILNERRGAGLKVTGGKARHQTRWFEALLTLARENIEAFGVYLDMSRQEIIAMVANCSLTDRRRAAKDLEFLAGCLSDLAQRITPKKM